MPAATEASTGELAKPSATSAAMPARASAPSSFPVMRGAATQQSDDHDSKAHQSARGDREIGRQPPERGFAARHASEEEADEPDQEDGRDDRRQRDDQASEARCRCGR